MRWGMFLLTVFSFTSGMILQALQSTKYSTAFAIFAGIVIGIWLNFETKK